MGAGSSRRQSGSRRFASELGSSQLDDLVAASVQYRTQHIEAESLRMGKFDLRKHRKLMLRCDHIDECGTGMRKRMQLASSASHRIFGIGVAGSGADRAASQRPFSTRRSLVLSGNTTHS